MEGRGTFFSGAEQGYGDILSARLKGLDGKQIVFFSEVERSRGEGGRDQLHNLLRLCCYEEDGGEDISHDLGGYEE